MNRPSKDLYFLEIAHSVARRASCPRKNVGAILVSDGNIIASGYNGAPRGEAHCSDIGCLLENNSCARAIHAEVNCLTQANLTGISTNNSTLYLTLSPCHYCVGVIINAGIKRIVYSNEYRKKDGILRAQKAGIKIEQIPFNKLNLDDLRNLPIEKLKEILNKVAPEKEMAEKFIKIIGEEVLKRILK